MIVVVIIGILAAVAVPQFKQVKNNSAEKALLNDARLIGSAAQEVALESGVNTITISFTTIVGQNQSTWQISANNHVRSGQLTPNVRGTGGEMNIEEGTFSLSHAQYDNTDSGLPEAAKAGSNRLTFTAVGKPTS